MSCFVTEVEALLRFNHIDYLKKVSRPGSPSPKGQVGPPTLRSQLRGQVQD